MNKTKLYSCTATINEDMSLTSYSTKVVDFYEQGNWRICYLNKASITTMQHIRKYINWLSDMHEDRLANLLEDAYIMSKGMGRKVMFAYNFLTEEILLKETSETPQEFWDSTLAEFKLKDL